MPKMAGVMNTFNLFDVLDGMKFINVIKINTEVVWNVLSDAWSMTVIFSIMAGLNLVAVIAGKIR